MLDASPTTIDGLGKESRPVLGVGFVRNDGADAARACGCSVCLGIIALVGDGCAGFHVWADVEQQRENRAVARLATGQVEGEWPGIEVGLEVDLGREAASRAAERLVRLPPFMDGPPLPAGQLIGCRRKLGEKGVDLCNSR